MMRNVDVSRRIPHVPNTSQRQPGTTCLQTFPADVLGVIAYKEQNKEARLTAAESTTSRRAKYCPLFTFYRKEQLQPARSRVRVTVTEVSASRLETYVLQSSLPRWPATATTAGYELSGKRAALFALTCLSGGWLGKKCGSSEGATCCAQSTNRLLYVVLLHHHHHHHHLECVYLFCPLLLCRD